MMHSLALAFLLISPATAASARNDVLLQALRSELDRSFAQLKNAEKTPLYYLSYEARENWTYDVMAEMGALHYQQDRHRRTVDADTRVGAYKLDNTHQIKGRQGWYEQGGGHAAPLPLGDEPDAIREALWRLTDVTFKAAQERYTKVATNKAVTAKEDDQSNDFSQERKRRHYAQVRMPKFDSQAWATRVRRLSREFKKYPFIIDSYVSFSVRAENRYILNSEGSEIVTGNVYVRLSYTIKARTDDGMDLSRFYAYNADDPSDLPADDVVLKDMQRSAEELRALHQAPLIEPYSGPAIFRNHAAGVYFHEILGHRLEGHRQKLEEEGQTFTKKLGKEITAPFISVHDDPTQDRFNGTFLRGTYAFDDEGVPAERVPLIKKGVLKGFLLSRSPIKGFPKSNGHGRRSHGKEVVARMGNLLVEAAKSVPYSQLREMLIAEVKKQKKPYGLIFEDISGGFTSTSRYGTQSFKVIPLLVYRVYADGRPDEAVRGVDVVGTPLASFTKIIAAGDDPGIFNGTCGAESGWVPVSAVSPSILISEIEVEKKIKSSEKPPILPPPLHDPEAQP
jgi:TldD protein